MDDNQKHCERKNHPKDKTNFLSYLLFLYTIPLFKKGIRKEIKAEDLYNVPSNYTSEKLFSYLHKNWIKLKQEKRNVFRLICITYGPYFLLLGVVKIIAEALVIFIQPEAVSKIVSYFVPNQNKTTQLEAYLNALLLIGIKLLFCIYEHNNKLWIDALGIRIRAAFFSFIYRKLMRIDYNSEENVGIGKIVTLITKDVQTLENFLEFGNEVWSNFIKMIIICILLYLKFSKDAIVPILILWIVVPIQVYASMKMYEYERKTCERSEVRYGILQEIFSAIKLIKMYTWERFFESKTTKSRKKEVTVCFGLHFIKISIQTVSVFGVNSAKYVLLILYMQSRENVKPETVFFIVTCFRLLTLNFSVRLPLGLNSLGKLCACVKRINKLIHTIELEEKKFNEKLSTPSLSISNLTVFVNNQKLLESLKLKISKPSLTIITGKISSGKTTFLKALLSEYKTEGSFNIEGAISYSSQNPWLFPSTVRQNILFGEEFDEKRYKKVVQVCALEYDFRTFKNEDLTIVEDNGSNLSKGQRVRINLARAIYKNSDIYLLDNCLTSLDVVVRFYILEECICKFLKDKIVVLVTQNKTDFKYADKIVTLEKGGIKNVVHTEKCFDFKFYAIEENFDFGLDDEEVDETTKLLKVKASQVYSEVTEGGAVTWKIYKRYIKAAGGYFLLLCIICFFIIAQIVTNYNDRLLRNWVNLSQKNFTITNSTEIIQPKTRMIHLYGIIMVCMTFTSFFREAFLFLYLRKASENLHQKTLNIINACMSFFDEHYLGNTLNRFSKDFNVIDEFLPMTICHFIRQLLIIFGIIILLCTVNITFALHSAILCALLCLLRHLYIKTGRNLRRLEASLRSPLVGYINSTIEGITTIRAYRRQSTLIEEFDNHQNFFTSNSYTLKSSLFAFTFVLDFVSIMFIATILLKLLIDGRSSPGDVGLAISQASLLVLNVQFGVRHWSEVENQMTSVERVLEYADVEQEKNDGCKKVNWPEFGEIQFNNVFLTYPNEYRPALKNINLSIKSKEIIGIVGRTGSGKSSLFSILSRLYDFDGEITIDNVNIKNISLEFLRSHISIIPQDAVIFDGTIRDNIDPKRLLNDEELWKIIEIVNLKYIVSDLDALVDKEHFSAGQKQLISLARAVALKNKIILLDEPSANLDDENVILIKKIIETFFQSATLLIVAHNLETILQCDQIVVLDNGCIVEKGSPNNLLSQKGIFSEIYNYLV